MGLAAQDFQVELTSKVLKVSQVILSVHRPQEEDILEGGRAQEQVFHVVGERRVGVGCGVDCCQGVAVWLGLLILKQEGGSGGD